MQIEYDSCLFEKIDGKWVCKSWAMKGPTGVMMNKVVPEPFQSKIEDYFLNGNNNLSFDKKTSHSTNNKKSNQKDLIEHIKFKKPENKSRHGSINPFKIK
jgi:hypothetical protein